MKNSRDDGQISFLKIAWEGDEELNKSLDWKIGGRFFIYFFWVINQIQQRTSCSFVIQPRGCGCMPDCIWLFLVQKKSFDFFFIICIYIYIFSWFKWIKSKNLFSRLVFITFQKQLFFFFLNFKVHIDTDVIIYYLK